MEENGNVQNLTNSNKIFLKPMQTPPQCNRNVGYGRQCMGDFRFPLLRTEINGYKSTNATAAAKKILKAIEWRTRYALIELSNMAAPIIVDLA